MSSDLRRAAEDRCDVEIRQAWAVQVHRDVDARERIRLVEFAWRHGLSHRISWHVDPDDLRSRVEKVLT